MNYNSTKFVVEIVWVGLFSSWQSISAKLQLKRKLKIVIDFDSVHLFEVPAEALESDNQQIRQLP